MDELLPTLEARTDSAPLAGLRVAIVGRLAGMSKRDAQEMIRQRGGAPSELANLAADGKIEGNDCVGVSKRLLDIAIALPADGRLARQPGREFARWIIGVHQRRQFFDLHDDKIGRVLSHIGVVGEHRRYRLPDIAHAIACQDRLPVWRQLLNRAFPEINGRNIRDVVGRPHSVDAG